VSGGKSNERQKKRAAEKKVRGRLISEPGQSKNKVEKGQKGEGK